MNNDLLIKHLKTLTKQQLLAIKKNYYMPSQINTIINNIIRGK